MVPACCPGCVAQVRADDFSWRHASVPGQSCGVFGVSRASPGTYQVLLAPHTGIIHVVDENVCTWVCGCCASFGGKHSDHFAFRAQHDHQHLYVPSPSTILRLILSSPYPSHTHFLASPERLIRRKRWLYLRRLLLDWHLGWSDTIWNTVRLVGSVHFWIYLNFFYLFVLVVVWNRGRQQWWNTLCRCSFVSENNEHASYPSELSLFPLTLVYSRLVVQEICCPFGKQRVMMFEESRILSINVNKRSMTGQPWWVVMSLSFCERN